MCAQLRSYFWYKPVRTFGKNGYILLVAAWSNFGPKSVHTFVKNGSVLLSKIGRMIFSCPIEFVLGFEKMIDYLLSKIGSYLRQKLRHTLCPKTACFVPKKCHGLWQKGFVLCVAGGSCFDNLWARVLSPPGSIVVPVKLLQNCCSKNPVVAWG